MKISKIITLASVIVAMSASQMFGAITLGIVANSTTGLFKTTDGTTNANGEVRVGYLNEAGVGVGNFDDYNIVAANFTQLFTRTIANGAVSQTGINVGNQTAGQQLYVWAFNDATGSASSNQWGIFKAPSQWLTPADLGNTNLVTNAASKTAVFGTLSGSSLVYATTVPEPSTYAAIFGIAVLGLAVLRRRAKQA